MIFRRKRSPYSVTMHLSGRHPYLKDNSLDVPSRDVIVVVQARSWADAERQAFRNVPQDKPSWSVRVKSIARGDHFALVSQGRSIAGCGNADVTPARDARLLPTEVFDRLDAFANEMAACGEVRDPGVIHAFLSAARESLSGNDGRSG